MPCFLSYTLPSDHIHTSLIAIHILIILKPNYLQSRSLLRFRLISHFFRNTYFFWLGNKMNRSNKVGFFWWWWWLEKEPQLILFTGSKVS